MELEKTYTFYESPISVNNPYQILKIWTNGEDRFLIKNQVPIGAVWRGDNESSAFYAYIAQNNPDIIKIEDLDKMNLNLEDKVSSNNSFSKIISPLLNIVENGWYQIFYHQSIPTKLTKLNLSNCVGINNYNFINNFKDEKKKINVWIDETIVFTQKVSTLDKERIEYYKNEITNGRRPMVVLMGIAALNFENIEVFNNSNNEKQRAMWVLEGATQSVEPQFIIDGHHKAQAYIELGIKPSMISLIKLQFKDEFFKSLNEEHKLKEWIEDEIKEQIK